MSIRHLMALLLVGVVGLLLDAHGLAGWADSLPDAAAPIAQAAHWWDDTTTRLGLAAPYDALHGWVRGAIAAPF